MGCQIGVESAGGSSGSALMCQAPELVISPLPPKLLSVTQPSGRQFIRRVVAFINRIELNICWWAAAWVPAGSRPAAATMRPHSEIGEWCSWLKLSAQSDEGDGTCSDPVSFVATHKLLEPPG
jgi:hypothetical protein